MPSNALEHMPTEKNLGVCNRLPPNICVSLLERLLTLTRFSFVALSFSVLRFKFESSLVDADHG